MKKGAITNAAMGGSGRQEGHTTLRSSMVHGEGEKREESLISTYTCV